MPQIKRLRYAQIFLTISILSAGVRPGAAEMSAIVKATTEPNLRSGPGLEYPSIKVLKDGERVVVEKQEGEWYGVIAAGGLKGYLHTTVLSFPEVRPSPTVARDKPQSSQDTDVKAADTPRHPAPVVPPRVASSPPKSQSPAPAIPSAVQNDSSASAEKSSSASAPSLMQLLEGRERDMVLWLTIAVAFFLIGWICGGNYYLRRDRIRRTKLRF